MKLFWLVVVLTFIIVAAGLLNVFYVLGVLR